MCRSKALKKGDTSCLSEQIQKLKKKTKKKSKVKGETGDREEL